LSLAIRRRSDGEAAGWVELRPAADQADVSYIVAAEARGQGLVPQALEALFNRGSREIGLRDVNLTCHAENSPLGGSPRTAASCSWDESGTNANSGGISMWP
jgi:RimJ/RimL family protein N-acetyltransferase